MQFTTISLTLLALGASAMPAHSETDNSIAKRTCGELKGIPLKICQGVCIGACVSGPIRTFTFIPIVSHLTLLLCSRMPYPPFS